MVQPAPLYPSRCGFTFGNMTGEREPFSATFATHWQPAKPYMASCKQLPFCGRSGQCYRENQPNKICGPRQPYAFGFCSQINFPQ